MISRLSIICLLLLVSQGLCDARPWMNQNLTPEERTQLILSQMTLDEKIGMVHGYKGVYVGNVPANERLGIPSLNMNDASQVNTFC